MASVQYFVDFFKQLLNFAIAFGVEDIDDATVTTVATGLTVVTFCMAGINKEPGTTIPNGVICIKSGTAGSIVITPDAGSGSGGNAGKYWWLAIGSPPS